MSVSTLALESGRGGVAVRLGGEEKEGGVEVGLE